MTESEGNGRHFSTRSPDREWDTVVIGSGMGGMTTAALLAKLGQRVLVLEQHYVPGGFTHTFKRKRWVWDVGVHAVGEVSDAALLGRVLHGLTDGRLEWASLGGVYDEFHYPDLRIDFPDNRPAFVDAVCEAFPDERDAMRQYLQATREVLDQMKRWYLGRILPASLGPTADRTFARHAARLLAQRTGDVLARFSRNERFTSVLTSQWGYYGSPPTRSSWGIHALVARHFFHGGYYPVGGASRIAECLLATVANAGGWTRIRSPVREIVVRDGRAVGVTLEGGEEIRARRVVSAAGAHATVDSLLPESHRASAWARSFAPLAQSPAHVCLYLGFKGDIRAAGASAANKWFYESWRSDWDAWHADDPRADAPVLYCSFPSLKDPDHDPGPDLLHTGEVVTFVPYDMFAPWRDGRWRRRGEEYESLKKSLEQRLLDQFLRHLPALRPHVAFAELSTPISTEHFTRSPRGAIYGLEPTPARFANRWLRPRTPIPGLFLSGCDVGTVGVMGAMLGGVLSATAAEPVAALRYLRDFAKPIHV